MKLRLLFTFLLLALLMSCSSSPEQKPLEVKPSIASFNADKAAITKGESVTLSWSGAMAGANLRLSPGSLDVTGKSSAVVTPVETTTYTLEISNTAGIEWYTQLVTVIEATTNPTNALPVANAQTATTLKNTPVNLTLTGSDADGTTLKFTVKQLPTFGSLGTLGETTGTLSYTPNPDFVGTDGFTFTVSDGVLESAEATVTITVSNTGVGNTAPEAQSQSITTNEDVAKGIVLTASDNDGNELNYTIIQVPVHGTLSGNAPNVTYTPNANYNGTDSFTFKVNDGFADSVSATVTIEVVAVNDAPTATAQTRSVAQNGSLAITLTGSDGDGDILTFKLETQPRRGTLTNFDATTGTVTYTPNRNVTGSDSFTFSVLDGAESSSPATVSITIGGTNSPPTANAQNLSTNEDIALAITLTGSDPEGSSLSYTVVASPSKGSLTGTAPNLSYTPNANYFGTDSFTFKVNDGARDSVTVTVNLTINAVNDAPIANNASRTLSEDSSINLSLSGTDVEKSSLTYSIVATPTHGTLSNFSATSGTLTYTPTADYTGSDSFTYKVNDGSLDSGLATVSLTITNSNDAPVATAQTVTTNEDASLGITLSASDIDGDSLSYTVVTSPSHGTLSGTAPNLSYTPSANYTGTDSFTFRANDGSVNSATATVSIIVNPVNDTPVANIVSKTTTEDTLVSITLSSTDIDDDALTYSLVTQPANGSLSNFNSTIGTLDYNPTANFTGSDSFTYKANDGSADSNVAIVNITVNKANDAPVATGQTLSTSEDSSISITLTATDNDGDTLSYAVVTQPAHGSLSGSAPNLTYTPNANYNGADSFTFKANDGVGDSNTATINLTIDATNDAPVATALSRSTQEDTATVITLTGSDVDGDTLTFALESQPSNGALSNFDAASGTVTYTPATNFTGNDSFNFNVSDGVASSSATVSINVGVVNDAPVANSQTVSTDEDTSLAISLSASDTEGDTLMYAVVNAPTRGTLSGTAPDLTYTPNANFNGSDSFTFKANDGVDDSATATITIIVNAVNDLPEASDITLNTNEDTALAITLAGFDAEGDGLEYQVVDAPTNGSLPGTSSNRTYTPSANFFGTDSFTYKVGDAAGDSEIKTVTITVNAVNDKPSATAGSHTTLEDTAINFALSGSDLENDALTFAIATTPAHGTLTISGNQATYSPDKDYNGTDSFTFIAHDGSSDSEPATISITIDTQNDAPVAEAQTVSTNEDTALNITLTATDVEGDSLTYSVVTSPLHGTLSGTAPALTYTPTTNYNGADSFTFKANDGDKDSEIVTVSLTVNAVNDKPSANTQNLTTDEDTPLALTLTGSDTEGDTLTYSIVSSPSHGTLSGIAPNLTYTPALNYNGSDEFSFVVNDGTDDSEAVTVSLTVDAVNDAPVAEAQSVEGDEDTSLTITLTGSDMEGSSLTYTITTHPTHGTLSGTAPNLSYTPEAGFSGSDSFGFTVSDGEFDSSEATVSITVNGVNDAPSVSDGGFTTNEDTAGAITLSASDPEGDALTYTIVTSPTNGTLSGTAPNLTYTPKSNVNSSDSFTFKVNDGMNDSSVARVSITITPVNDKPVAKWLTYSMNEDGTLAVQLEATDVEGSTLTYSVTSPENGGKLSSFSATNGTVTFTPASNFNGTDQFSYLANDGELNSSRVYVTITVNAVNDAPTATSSSVTTNEDTSKSITLSGSDVDGNTLSYTVVTNPSKGTLSGTAPNLTYTPTANYFGSDSFTFKVNDGTVDSATGTISITISSVNDKPTANAQSVTVDKNKSTSITLTGSDTENWSLTYTIVTNPSKGTLSGSGATRTYTPTTGYTGTDSFTFKVNDGTEDSSTATVSITVVDPQPPTINNFASSLTLASTSDSITFSWSVSSPDGDTVACTLNMGDGTSYSISDCVNTTSKTHTYSTTGFYTPTLTATDNDGSDSEKTYVTIDTFSSSSFDIHVVFTDDTMTSSQRSAFTTAATRWEKIITADKTGYASGTRTCSGYSFTGTIDDLVIIATAPSLDGVGGTLGSAGPCATLSNMPLYGLMKFDIADIADLETDGDLNNVILHEMGHVLGIGTLWSTLGLNNTTAHTYSGTNAVSQYSTLKGSTQSTIPTENGGGSGTADSHWEEDVFDNELMTGYLDSGRTNSLSRVTVGALQDLGYTVNYAQADSYSLPSAFALKAPDKHIEVHSDPLGPPIELGSEN